jgi:hypothetical protein
MTWSSTLIRIWGLYMPVALQALPHNHAMATLQCTGAGAFPAGDPAAGWCRGGPEWTHPPFRQPVVWSTLKTSADRLEPPRAASPFPGRSALHGYVPYLWLLRKEPEHSGAAMRRCAGTSRVARRKVTFRRAASFERVGDWVEDLARTLPAEDVCVVITHGGPGRVCRHAQISTERAQRRIRS